MNQPENALPEFGREVTRQLYMSSSAPILGGVLLSLIVTFILWESHPGPALLGWMVLTECIYLARFLLARAHARAADQGTSPWLNRLRTLAILQGSAWGLSALLFMPEHPGIDQIAFLFALIGIAGAASGAFALDRVSLLGFEITMLGSLMARLAWNGSSESFLMTLMVLIYLIYIIFSARTNIQSLRENIALRLASHERVSDMRISAIAFESPQGIVITDPSGTILRVNRAFTEISGYSSEEAVGRNPRFLSSGQHDKEFYRQMWKIVLKTGTWNGEVWNRRKNGELYPEHLTITAVRDENGMIVNYVGTLTDITHRKASEEAIQRLAFHDQLTDLPNRRLLLDRLGQALLSTRRQRNLGGLLFIDMDNFKTINDTQGHAAGDMLLKEVAHRLTASVRSGDTVARLGGDEFVVLLEDLSGKVPEAISTVENVGNKILHTLGLPYQLGTSEHNCTPSIGVTLFGQHAANADDLLKQADIAMYQAKKAGRNTLRFFDQAMQETLNRHAVLETDLRTALDKGQFELFYQIQVDHRDRPIGAETLLRWRHPERGLVSPAEFIPHIEESGLIQPIGIWMIDQVCERIRKWDEQGIFSDLVIAVNVSASQFHQPNFARLVQTSLDLHGVKPYRIKLELTESIVLKDIEDTIRTMNILSEMGLHLALDDFGTGYSSLQYLKRLPIDQLKIDQSFVRELTTNLSDQAIVQTIIAMAESLGLDVIAEGVESDQQRRMLHRNGCHHYQGYLFGPPVPVSQFEKMLKENVSGGISPAVDL